MTHSHTHARQHLCLWLCKSKTHTCTKYLCVCAAMCAHEFMCVYAPCGCVRMLVCVCMCLSVGLIACVSVCLCLSAHAPVCVHLYVCASVCACSRARLRLSPRKVVTDDQRYIVMPSQTSLSPRTHPAHAATGNCSNVPLHCSAMYDADHTRCNL